MRFCLNGIIMTAKFCSNKTTEFQAKAEIKARPERQPVPARQSRSRFESDPARASVNGMR